MAPNVAPWSPEVNDRMYGMTGWQDKLDIYMKVPNTAIQITEKYILSWGYKLKKSSLFSDPAVKFYEGNGRRNYQDIYVYLQKEKIKYRIDCWKPSPNDNPLRHYHCDIHFRYKNKYPVTITFGKRFLPQWITIAKETEATLELLEAMGKTYEKYQQKK